jgi:hypothetical protein
LSNGSTIKEFDLGKNFPCNRPSFQQQKGTATMLEIRAPLQSHIVQCLVQPSDAVTTGQLLMVLEAMKMEHEITAPMSGEIRALHFSEGEAVGENDVLMKMQRSVSYALPVFKSETVSSPSSQRTDLKRLQVRLEHTLDVNRPEAVAKRHALGLRTARENIADLCDADSFSEYGALAVAAQSQRRTADDLIRNTPADGMVTGIGSIHGQRCAILAYDATVLAGMQGMRNHQKTDRLLGLALEHHLPVVLFSEGGGGRPGDVDMPIVAGLHVATFARQREVIKALAQAGANLGLLENDRYDAVTIASVADDEPTLHLLLELGASAKLTTSRYDGTALIAAAHLGHDGVVRQLIAAGAPLDHVNNLHWTALIESIVLGDGGARHQAVLQALLQAGASTRLTDREGNTPLALAQARGYKAMAEMLKKSGT